MNHSKLIRTLSFGGAVAMLSGCAGMTAPYSSKSIEPDSISVIPVTPDLIAQQAKLAAIDNVPTDLFPTNITTAKDYRYLVGPGDTLLISVPAIVSLNSPSTPSILGEQGQGYTVYDDGTVYLPYTGSIKVAGLTLKQIQENIVRSLSGYLRSPQVVVSVGEFRSQRIMITGQVPKPGYIPVTDVPLTLVGALANTGALTQQRGSNDPRPIGQGGANALNVVPLEYADLSRVLLRRDGVTYSIDATTILKTGQTEKDLVLIDGDVVVIPPVERVNAFVLGEVLRPGLLEIDPRNTNLAKALLATGGVDQLTANASRVYVIRGDYRKPTVFQVDAEHPDALLLAQHFQLLPNDVIFVSAAGATRWNRGLQQVLPTVQSLLSTAIIVNTVDDLTKDN